MSDGEFKIARVQGHAAAAIVLTEQPAERRSFIAAMKAEVDARIEAAYQADMARLYQSMFFPAPPPPMPRFRRYRRPR